MAETKLFTHLYCCEYPLLGILVREIKPLNELTVHFKTHDRALDPDFLARLGAVAEEYNVSVNNEARQVIDKAMQHRKARIEEFIRKADAISKNRSHLQR